MSLPGRPLAAVILAAGQGTRMKSDLHKVLHPIAGRPMLVHLLATLDALAPARTVVVAGARAEQIEAAVAGRGIVVAHQAEQLGTAHAVRQAEGALSDFSGDVLILYGDVPLVRAETLRGMLDLLDSRPDAASVVLAFDAVDPTGYGRVVANADGIVVRMVEHKDATVEERAIRRCNSGLMAVRSGLLWDLLGRVGDDNVQREYYLPDIVMIAADDGRPSVVAIADEAEVRGVNSRGELAAVEAIWQARARADAMAGGASLIAPDSVFFSYDTRIGRDAIVEPNVVFGPGVEVADGARIRAFSHLEGARVGPGADVGPYARLRPGAVLEDGAKVGNFVEVKQAVLGKGAKANHLSYIGDADIGAGANIGAGTITCNYDGFFKYRTVIGENAFIGSNSALVAPVSVGAGAIVGAGAVITADVDADALALVRAEQKVKPGWARRFRDVMIAKKGSG